MSEWRETTLAEVSERVDYGFTASAVDDLELPRLLRITDIVGSHIDWASVPGCVVDSAKFEKFSLRRGDIVVARTGATVGHAKRIREHPAVVFASYLVRFRPSPLVDPAFVGAVVESQVFKDWVLQHAGGAAQPNANAKILGAFPFLLPDRVVQERVGQILSFLDDLIENNRRRIELLEQMAQAIHREWFVKFRYPGHEDATFVDSSLGPIPEGWHVERVGQLVKVIMTTADPLTLEPNTPAVGLEHIPRMRLTLDDWGAAESLTSKKNVFKEGDLLFGKIRPYFHKVSVAPIDGICSTDAIVIRPDPDLWGLVVFSVSSEEFVANATQTSNGTKMPRADWKVIGEFPVAVPPQEIARGFNDVAHDSLGTAQKLMMQNRQLAALRDVLLPKLVTGQIDVSALDLDALAESVA